MGTPAVEDETVCFALTYSLWSEHYCSMVEFCSDSNSSSSCYYFLQLVLILFLFLTVFTHLSKDFLEFCRPKPTLSNQTFSNSPTTNWKSAFKEREREREKSLCVETEERKQEGGNRSGKYSGLQSLDDQAQTERLPGETVEDKNNTNIHVCVLMKARLV